MDQNKNENNEEYESPVIQASQKIEVTIKEAEVLKITPQPGDVLFFKFKGDYWDSEQINVMGRQIRSLFPANKCVVMVMPDGHDLELTSVANQDKLVPEAKDCSEPTSYCSDCSCGKKERIESEGK